MLDSIGFQALLHAGRELNIFPCRADRSFVFPDRDYYEALAERPSGTLDMHEIVALYRSMFSAIALDFSPRASATVIKAETRAIVRRVGSKPSKRPAAEPPAAIEDSDSEELVEI